MISNEGLCMSRKRSVTTGPSVRELKLNDFELYDTESGVHAVVSGHELRAAFSRLADLNGFILSDLLANNPIPAGKPLPCRIATTLPEKLGWFFEDSGYIMLKMHRAATVVGHSFLGREASASADASYSGAAPSRLEIDATSPPRTRKRPAEPPSWLQEHSMSPGTPDLGQEGRTQPLPVRLHRAAALSVSGCPECDGKLILRHICGNKRCMVVAHFRPGTQAENSDDRDYHKTMLGCSREKHPCLQ